jgi:hypothetical protein
MRKWSVEEMDPETVKRGYPELWAFLSNRYEGWSDVAIASLASVIVDTCSTCYAADSGCQCWNDK